MKEKFTEKVREAVKEIERGSVMTYKQIAEKAGVPKAYRAVGSIMAKNKDPSVPCHRVIRTDRIIGAYNRGGPERKKELLEKEGVAIKKIENKYKVI